MESSTIHPKNQAGKNSIVRNIQQFRPEVQTINMRKIYRLQQIRPLTSDTYVLRFDRNGMIFKAGQHLTLGIPGNNQVREYSIYSTEQDTSLEVLIKQVDNGLVSKQLKKLIPGELLEVDGPFGYFTIEEQNLNKKFLFIGTGTGIAPFHSIIGSNRVLNYELLHGVRYSSDAYEKHRYPADRFKLCASRDQSGDFNGRVTEYLKQMSLDSDTLVYLCGNCDMIYDVYDLLTARGFPSGNIKTEVYF